VERRGGRLAFMGRGSERRAGFSLKAWFSSNGRRLRLGLPKFDFAHDNLRAAYLEILAVKMPDRLDVDSWGGAIRLQSLADEGSHAVRQKFLGDDDPQSVVMRGGGEFDVKTH
jgi:hypothetical protein